ncbi:DUF4176 domain-containing protein [Paenibacillus oralis]|uniref:DUF4176 domain-containing protein n=1 Tax=Paenibacillus oralis TaxID=2490856 RepID=A0A3P3U556_9BACL|nr:DUF4176 domain-containing protein [Paenibacillus oralis]RRJ65497.1 DUF4176 domain-containing protein [Paenibacillus oralis]
MHFLPNGTIVQLKGGNKKIMIFGRMQTQADTGQVWDYIACLYPEGLLNPNQVYLFNQEQVEQVIFTGFQDMEELAYNQFLQELKQQGDSELKKEE